MSMLHTMHHAEQVERDDDIVLVLAADILPVWRQF